MVIRDFFVTIILWRQHEVIIANYHPASPLCVDKCQAAGSLVFTLTAYQCRK